MISKIKEYSIFIIIFLLVLFGTMESCNKYEKAKLEKQNALLIAQGLELSKTIKDQEKNNLEIKKIIADQNIVITNVQKISDTAIARLEKLEKIKDIAPTNDPVGVKEFVSNTYGDSTISYSKPNFLVLDTTMYPLVTDAKEWRINGPILKTNLLETTNALNLLRNTDKEKSLQLVFYEKRVDGLEKVNELKSQFLANKDGQLVIAEKQLKVERNGAILTNVKVAITCAFAGWAYEHFRKK